MFQCLLPDETVFKPTGDIIKKLGTDYHSLQQVLHDEQERERKKRIPPHALLSEDEADEHPVHNHDSRYVLRAIFPKRDEL